MFTIRAPTPCKFDEGLVYPCDHEGRHHLKPSSNLYISHFLFIVGYQSFLCVRVLWGKEEKWCYWPNRSYPNKARDIPAVDRQNAKEVYNFSVQDAQGD